LPGYFRLIKACITLSRITNWYGTCVIPSSPKKISFSNMTCYVLKNPGSICYVLKNPGSICYDMKYPSICYGLKCSGSICYRLKYPGSILSSLQGCNLGGDECTIRPSWRSPRGRVLAVALENFPLNLRRIV